MNTRTLWLGKPFLFCLGVLILNDHVLKAAYPGPLSGKLSDFAGLFAFAYALSVWGLTLGQVLRQTGTLTPNRVTGRTDFRVYASAKLEAPALGSEPAFPSASFPTTSFPTTSSGQAGQAGQAAKTPALLMHLATALFFVWWKLPVSDAAIAAWNAIGVLPLQRTVDPTDLWALLVLPFSYVAFSQGTRVLAKADPSAGQPRNEWHVGRLGNETLAPEPVPVGIGDSPWRRALGAVVAFVALGAFVATSTGEFEPDLRLFPNRALSGTYTVSLALDSLRERVLRTSEPQVRDPTDTRCLTVAETSARVLPLLVSADSTPYFVEYAFRLRASDSTRSTVDSVVVTRANPQDQLGGGSSIAALDSAFAALPDSILLRRFERTLVAPLQTAIRFGTTVEVGSCL